MNSQAKQSEILFLWDAENCNPNGDILNSNAPRFDEISHRALVSDVRIKRNIRDYFIALGEVGLLQSGFDIFVREQMAAESEGLADAKERVRTVVGDEKDRLKALKEKCIDVRAFGGVFPGESAKKKPKRKGQQSEDEQQNAGERSYNLTGAVQFKVTKSLHETESLFIKGTGAFASSAGKDNKTFREEYVLPYALFSTYGTVNAFAARNTNLSEGDVAQVVKALWSGLKNNLTRSKIGQTPRVLIKITYTQPGVLIGELDNRIQLVCKAAQENEIRSIDDYEIDFGELAQAIEHLGDKVQKVEYAIDERFKKVAKNIPGSWKSIEIEQ